MYVPDNITDKLFKLSMSAVRIYLFACKCRVRKEKTFRKTLEDCRKGMTRSAFYRGLSELKETDLLRSDGDAITWIAGNFAPIDAEKEAHKSVPKTGIASPENGTTVPKIGLESQKRDNPSPENGTALIGIPVLLESNDSSGEPPDDEPETIWTTWVEIDAAHGVNERAARARLGKLVKQFGTVPVASTLTKLKEKLRVVPDAYAYFTAALKNPEPEKPKAIASRRYIGNNTVEIDWNDPLNPFLGQAVIE